MHLISSYVVITQMEFYF